MKINVANHGDVYDIYVDGEEAGFARIHHGWDSDLDKMLHPDSSHSAWFSIKPKFRGTGVAEAAYRLIVEHERLKGQARIYGIPISPVSKGFMRKVGFRSTGEKVAITQAQREGAEPPDPRMKLRLKKMFEE